LDFVHPDDLAATLEEMKLLNEGKKAFHFENRYWYKNGEYKRLVWSAVASGGKEHSLSMHFIQGELGPQSDAKK